MKIAANMLELTGHTPLVRLNRISEGCAAQVLAKLEYFNPASSVKDRAAKQMILEAEKQGLLHSHGTVIEATSGNTGIGLAFVCAVRGYQLILTMPENMSQERKALLRGMGATLVLTPQAGGMRAAVEEAERIAQATPGAFFARQFENPANPLAHYRTTAEEIWEDTEGSVDIFVSAVGTSGTLTGTAKRLKELNPSVRIIAVEPKKSAVLSGSPAGPHGIPGIGAGFIPGNYDASLVDEIYPVEDEEAIRTARRLMREEGIFAGISSGAAAFAAVKIAMRQENAGRSILFIACDTAERYLSTILFQEHTELERPPITVKRESI